ncbi:MAG TPA: phosphoribosylformylglycinamidine cyclo-ligase [Vampirovibrionales bacterium]
MNLYTEAGVNIEEGNSFIEGLKTLPSNSSENVISGIGGFAGLYKLPVGYKKPVLVSCTDGVGSKLKLAYENNKLQGVGQDLVAMCVNDLLCCGARPLYFLDYLATEKLKKEEALIIANSIAQACVDSEMTLLGGETAELPGMLPPNGYELAGFATGVVEEDEILSAKNVQEGDVLLGLESSGFHSNGYSLVRKVIEENHLDLGKNYFGAQETLIDALLTPTELYTSRVLPILQHIKVAAHITGGGLLENIPRVLPSNLAVEINSKSWEPSEIFSFFQSTGNISTEEMFRVFNMGIGFVLIASKKKASLLTEEVKGLKVIGVVKTADEKATSERVKII